MYLPLQELATSAGTCLELSMSAEAAMCIVSHASCVCFLKHLHVDTVRVLAQQRFISCGSSDTEALQTQKMPLID